jgi:hypothetical protein
VHNDNGGYYGTSELGTANNAGTTGVAAGHPAASWGWATSAGFTLNNFLGFKGDTAGAQVAYCWGAEGYCSHSQAGSAVIGSGNRLTYATNEDAMYMIGTGISKTVNIDFTAFYEHYWNPKWRTSLFGGWLGVYYNATERTMICPVGFGGVNPGWGNMALVPGLSGCNPNYNTWQIGSRTMWNPHPQLDIGVEVIYTALNQSNTGPVVLNPAGAPNGGLGALNSGIYTFANSGVWSGLFRIQRNFLY